jgi:hypothetical protein
MPHAHLGTRIERGIAVAATVTACVAVLLLVFRGEDMADLHLFLLRLALIHGAALLGVTLPGFFGMTWSARGLAVRTGGALALAALAFLGTLDLPGRLKPDPIQSSSLEAGATAGLASVERMEAHAETALAAAPPSEREIRDLAGREIGRVVAGVVQYDTPASMRQGDVRSVEAVLGVGLDPAMLAAKAKALRERAARPGEERRSEAAELDVAPYMVATLSGLGFKIDPPGAQRRRVDKGRPTAWTWQVTAEESGERMLTLRFEAELAGANEPPVYVESFTRNITVEVDPQRLWDRLMAWFKDLQVLWAALVVPAAGLLYALVARARRRPRRRRLGRRRAFGG